MIRMISSALMLAVVLGLSPRLDAEAADQDVGASVQRALDEELSAAAIIKMLVEQGYSQAEATRIAVSETAGELQLDVAREGVCGSRDVQEAQSVGRAASEVAGEVSDEVIAGFVHRFITTGCSEDQMERPSRYLPSGTAPNAGDIVGPDVIGPSSPSS